MHAFSSMRAPGRAILCAAALVSLAPACGDDADDARQPSPTAAPPASGGPIGSSAGGPAHTPVPPATASPVSNQQQPTPAVDAAVTDAESTYFADVVANGTGCPPGTWKTQLAADKQTFTITFAAYEAEVTPQTVASIKDCQLALKLRSKKPVAYTVQTFAFDGHARLERGVNAKLMASYYFQGNPVDDVETRVDVSGPYDRAFSFRQQVGLPEQVWSGCGLERDLNVATRVRLMNSEPRASGRVNVAQGSSTPTLFVALGQRACP